MKSVQLQSHLQQPHSRKLRKTCHSSRGPLHRVAFQGARLVHNRRGLQVFASSRGTAVLERSQAAEFSGGHVQLRSESARAIKVNITLTNPGSFSPELNWGKVVLIGDNGKQSEPAQFWGFKGFTVSQLWGEEPKEFTLEAVVQVPDGYGTTGAVKIQDLSLFVADDRFWLKKNRSEWRTIFVNKAYLPSQTPSGLQDLRAKELRTLSCEDSDARLPADRVYDYDVYNDLGTEQLARPTLGGKDNPYPRRERTGRPLSNNAEGKEFETGFPEGDTKLAKIWNKLNQKKFYIPMDEEFSASKQTYFQKDTIFDALPIIITTLASKFLKDSGVKKAFSSIPAVGLFYQDEVWKEATTIPGALKLRAPTPLVYEGRTTAWDTDQEVGRQALAGQNPCMLEALRELSKDSAITEDSLAGSVEGHDVQELLAGGERLFQVDYSVLSQFLPEINSQKGEDGKPLVFMYATRAVFYLNDEGLLKPIALELIDVPDASMKKEPTVYTPSGDTHLWRLAKTFFASNDSGYHQLISHWLRTHCATEPYIIATHRQLSALHPVYALLHPHFKYTMPINRNARQNLVNAGGVIESTFAPGQYAMRISSAVYGLSWRFDQEALPADLLKRGMLTEDTGGDIKWKGKRYRRVLADYPYADDGLLIWDALQKYFSKYLKIYYPDTKTLQSDTEILAWWQEIKDKGHPDKKEGWPELKTVDDLCLILTTMVWVASGHHAAVNFGQYSYSGYMPNHPSSTHARMPNPNSQLKEDKEAWAAFKDNPDKTFLEIVSTREEALRVMVVVQLLSTYDPDEEFLGVRTEGWSSNNDVLDAWKEFKTNVEKIGEKIKKRNGNVDNKARFPDYNLLAPAGDDDMHELIRGHGIPNSISI
ncbi:hypothetical protein WJX74_005150 [Apatococcus lobatus]|uniref:Lipoxygenase domain-containing protein n=1 Tax=Apatococcus lobatus TaxID=904363 RepID=A0AAW1QDQ0_9CHLO